MSKTNDFDDLFDSSSKKKKKKKKHKNKKKYKIKSKTSILDKLVDGVGVDVDSTIDITVSDKTINNVIQVGKAIGQFFRGSKSKTSDKENSKESSK